jgi:pimeloyl-ACP methyl ester carboxylesterase
LGGAIAPWLAAEVKASALVLEATFTSAVSMAKERFPLFPSDKFCRFKYISIDVLKNIKCPVVVAHCKDDMVVPYKHGRMLFEAAGKPKLFVELDAAHARGLEVDVEYQRALRKFLISHFRHEGI